MAEKVLITGDKGYIGTELTRLCPDYESCDLKDGEDYRDLKDQEWDVVFHLAAYVSVSESFSKAADYFDNNTHGIRSLITHNKIGKLVLIAESRPGEVRRISLNISKAQQACLL